MTDALVLGAGGLTGIAWETGLLAGLYDAGIDLTDVTSITGTSAGAVVGANLASLDSGRSLEALYKTQIHALTTGTGEDSLAVPDLSGVRAAFAKFHQTSKSLHELRAAIGQKALESIAQGGEERRNLIRAWMPHDKWPERDLRILAVNALDGHLKIWDRNSEATLLQAVTSSCAIPAVYPMVEIAGGRYMDGGVGSTTNASIAEGFELVIVMDPIGDSRGVSRLQGEVEQLERGGTRTLVIVPDEEAIRALGSSPLDPSLCVAAGQAGRKQGRRVSAAVAAAREKIEDAFFDLPRQQRRSAPRYQ
ncbi:patatin-like phospholipase family protein [Granulicella sp. dw_53]|uniref:patatin-like phospholipase family protein n=1 Tax=Granulicella sp. dw_53 TaxID=2719792 RepID=UPI001BD1D5B8|nr:patatin-like phospholipase family protein [Granulicella sp. dw_53]